MPDLNTQKTQTADVASTSGGTSLEPLAREGSLRSRRRQSVAAERNAEFRARFRDVPQDEVVATEYSASLQKEIPIHGKLYVSQRYVSFYSNLFGWVTSVCVPFSDVISIEKKSKPLFVRSGIVVTTLHAKYYFVSFLQRDLAFNRLVSFLRNSQQEKPLSPEELLSIDEAYPYESESVFSDDDVTAAASASAVPGEDPTIQRVRSKSLSMEASGSNGGSSAAAAAPVLPERIATEVPVTPMKQRASSQKEQVGSPMAAVTEPAAAAASPSAPTPAATASAATTPRPEKAVDPKELNYVPLKTPILDVVLPGSIEVIYDKIFNPSEQFMRTFMRDNQRLLDLEFDPWATDAKGQETREYRYVMQLNAVMGPKSTRVFNKQKCITKDLPRGVVIENVSETPDVPSGDCFKTLNLYCLAYVDPSHTRFIMSGTIQFVKSTWIKSFIESHGTAGYMSFARDLERELRAELEPKGAARDKRKVSDKEMFVAPAPAPLPVTEEPAASVSDGLVAKVEGILLMVGIKVERAHIPRLAMVLLLAIMLIVQINALVHLGRTSRALTRLEVEAAVIRSSCAAPVTPPTQGIEVTAAATWANKVEALAARLEETEARLEKLYGKVPTAKSDEL